MKKNALPKRQMPLTNTMQEIKLGFWSLPDSITIAAEAYNKNVITLISKYCKMKYNTQEYGKSLLALYA